MDGPRALNEKELPELLELLNAVFRAPKGLPLKIGLEYSQFFTRKNLPHLRIIKDGGKIVSHAGFLDGFLIINGRRIKIGRVGMVATLPEYRGRKFASLLLKDCIKQMKKERCLFSVLWTSPKLYDFYRQFGYELNNSDALLFTLDRESINRLSISKDYQFLNFRNSYLKEIIKIHEKEPLRVSRDRDYYLHAITNKPEIFEGNRFEIFLAKKYGEIVSYFIPFASEFGSEFGGDIGGIKFLIKEFALRRKIKKIKIACPSFFPLREELDKLSIKKEREGEMILSLSHRPFPNAHYIWGLDHC